ncbi:dihydrolipoyllysine-residue acetyltransferase component of pyruvate dehydrogenase complex, mitochondrial isoform X2 [Maniola hyperantus]|uniref:dihydrolipoyllysine-residue acetyltransferase component of pyruvate dehydrogenase complex, mitochondrial isoform X2 n=1 Tax=Aphantopus hyperantus TaxID=2795564 RepID=UPI0015694750|nr:dihydrolipoyllysine-residue acetyltransferase component of pyruvate dehydrogenase complex, mitochondrial-like isoform X3 [Maniola hyperantus]
MLRTILVRNQVLNDNVKKAIRCNITRCISTELARRKQPRKLLSPSQKTVATPQWSIQMRYYSSLPSHIKVNLPALSPTMESGSIVSWEKKEGDKLNEGDLLCEIETDKATMGFETPEEGYLAKILIPAGTKGVAVGKLLCIIVENQADVAAFKDFKDDSTGAPAQPAAKKPAPAAAAPAPAAPAPAAAAPAAPRPAAPAAAPAPAAEQHGRIYASPMARRLAELKNIRLGGQGSGLYGSLKSGDLAAAATAPAPLPPPPAPAPGATFTDIPLSGMRETIAKRLSAAKQTIPHYQLCATVNVEKLLAMRKEVNERLAAEKSNVKVSVNDFILKAVAAACKRVPTVNSHWMETFIRQFSNVDVSVAVATPSGLITPIIFNADSRGILDISSSMKELANKAKEGRLQPHEYQGGTVTVSNLGMFGITMFNAIINPPQSLILACGGLQEIVIPDKNEPQGFRLAKFVTFTASADHRVIDGAVGAQWMKVLKENLENPANIIL